MILGLSGRAGHGKNLVADIIQYLICINKGKLEEDINNFEDFRSQIMDPDTLSGWEQKSFASKLKQIAALLLNTDVYNFENQDFKNSYLGKEWNGIVEGVLGQNKIKKITVREFLQKLGTDSLRNNLHQNIWINALFVDYAGKWIDSKNYPRIEGNNTIIGEMIQVDFPNWIITDCRFKNELKAIEDREGIVIRINRTFNHKMGSKETGTIDLTPQHPSEISLDNHNFKYVIENDSDIPSLIEKVKDILKQEKII